MKGTIKKRGPMTKYLKYVANSSLRVVEYLGDSRFMVECSCCRKKKRVFFGSHLERFAKKNKHYVCRECLRKEKFRRKYLNKRFGHLIILDEVVRKKTVYFKHRCDCGKVSMTRSFNIINGRTTSCGCSVHRGKEIKINGVFYRRLDAAKKFNVPYSRIVRNVSLGKKEMDILFWKKESRPSLSDDDGRVRKNKNLFALRSYGMKSVNDIAKFFGFSHQRLYQKINRGDDIISEFKKLYKERNEKENKKTN
jgi:RecJ-like exonuclease